MNFLKKTPLWLFSGILYGLSWSIFEDSNLSIFVWTAIVLSFVFLVKNRIFCCLLFLFPIIGNAQHSVAREWNEVLLHAIRKDYARPTVHARNLFHTSVLMYDAWAVFDKNADTYFLGKTINGFTCPFNGFSVNEDVPTQRAAAISYAMYRLLKHRFENSPGATETLPTIEAQFNTMGYDTSFQSTDYSTGNGAALGNYLAENMIQFGLQDGANEQNDYANKYYRSFNFPLAPEVAGNPFLGYPNRWQPLTLEVFIDQSGNPIPGSAPKFLSPEWGRVAPFALQEKDLTIHQRLGNDYWVYHNPATPPQINSESGGKDYQWGFSMVSLWSAHLDPTDGVMWDISPNSIGNIGYDKLPMTTAGLSDFYQAVSGGDISKGYTINPRTGQAYAPQIVPRGDYTRVLAEFWADGPDSETPPGHWFTILNYVNDHPQLERRFKGIGGTLDNLEWDVKAYLLLGGAMHDAAITTWGIKGWHDYIRPISAIRYMGDKGQSSDPNLPSFHRAGLPLEEGFIEIVEAGDPLAGENNEHVGKIKLYAWKGPTFITNPATDMAGVGWILSEQWWAYQRPTFVTPPFAGYVSGHSTFSRAAAEILTKLTGDPYFPGGLGEFIAKKNEFLVFEEGPSQDIVLQWATYRDASDQTSLSRIWGGIHPPADDIPGRIIGAKIATDVFDKATQYFTELCGNNNEQLCPLLCLPNTTYEGTASFKACDYVQSTMKIQNGSTAATTVTYEASQSINLLPGFEVAQGATFIAQIKANCSDALSNENNQASFSKEKPNEINSNKLAAIPATLSVYPNPFTNSTSLQIECKKTTNMLITLHDGNGKLIKKILANAALPVGIHHLELASADLPAGLYYLNMLSEQEKVIKKIILIK